MALVGTINSPNDFGLKNRIINGGMVIDQRNVGSAVTAVGGYTLDRWMAHENTDGAFTVQQVTTAPAGFSYSMKATVTTADTSIGASQNALFTQYIEGYNVADLGYGTANAQTVTLSFWVNSSVTGTFSGTLQNSAQDRSYPFTYTINAPNTWEKETITIAGDTSGTWLTTNGNGLRVWFAMAVGSGQSTTAGAWAAGTYYGATGQENWMATLGNTFYLTGVQLEKGSTATSFDYRPYGTELQLCQRYCHVFRPDAVATFSNIGFATVYSNTDQHVGITLPVSMRTAPTVTYSSISHIAIHLPGLVRVTVTSASVNTNQSGNSRIVLGTNTASSGDLVSHKSAHCEFNGTATGFLAFAAEL